MLISNRVHYENAGVIPIYVLWKKASAKYLAGTIFKLFIMCILHVVSIPMFATFSTDMDGWFPVIVNNGETGMNTNTMLYPENIVMDYYYVINVCNNVFK